VSFVVDSSAVLAIVREEDYRPDLIDLIVGNPICVTNFAECVSVLVRVGQQRADILGILRGFSLTSHALTHERATDAGLLYAIDPALSLGDRCCVSLGRALGLPVLTGDRRWKAHEAAFAVGVELIR
jgi:ribonuclease VapC